MRLGWGEEKGQEHVFIVLSFNLSSVSRQYSEETLFLGLSCD